MIEIRDAVILAKNAPKDPISFSFSSGILNLVDYSEFYKFRFLKLKDQALDKGEFIIDDVKIFPQDDDKMSLFFLDVNSLIRLSLCFVVDKEQKKERVRLVQDELIKLRELPTESEEQKQNKILKIFETVRDLKPSYVLFDFNDVNNDAMNILPSFFDQFANEMLIIALDRKPIEEVVVDKKQKRTKNKSEVEITIELSIGQPTETLIKTKEPKAPIEKEKVDENFLLFNVNVSNNFFKFFWFALSKNIMAFLSFIIPTIGVFAFCLLFPLYLNGDSKWLLIPFIITIVVCFSLYILMTYKCTDYVSDRHDIDRIKKVLTYMLINFVFTLVGVGLGFGVYYLFKTFNNSFKNIPFDYKTIILPIIIFIILITANLYVRFIGDGIVKLFKRKK